MNIPIGPHQRAGRRRRRGKTLVLCLAAIALALASCWVVRELPPAPDREPTATLLSALVRMRNEVALSPGLADDYAAKYPEYAPFIRGEVATVGECSAVG